MFLERGSFNKKEARKNKDECVEDEKETDAFTPLPSIQKNLLTSLMQNPILYQYLISTVLGMIST